MPRPKGRPSSWPWDASADEPAGDGACASASRSPRALSDEEAAFPRATPRSPAGLVNEVLAPSEFEKSLAVAVAEAEGQSAEAVKDLDDPSLLLAREAGDARRAEWEARQEDMLRKLVERHGVIVSLLEDLLRNSGATSRTGDISLQPPCSCSTVAASSINGKGFVADSPFATSSTIGAVGAEAKAAQKPPSKAKSKDTLTSERGNRKGGAISSSARSSHGEDSTPLQRLVASRAFEITCSLVIVANTIVMGVISQFEMETALERLHSGIEHYTYVNRGWYFLIEGFFLSFYTVELIVKILVFRKQFIHGRDRYWNILDIILVLAGTLNFTDVLFAGVNLTWVRALQIVKHILKALRVVRIVKFFTHLRVIVVSIAYSLQSFFWAMIVLLLLMYICAIVFVQGVSAYILSTPLSLIQDSVKISTMNHWSSMPKAILTEYKAVTGGGPWGVAEGPLDALQAAGMVYFMVFLIYISLLAIAVLRLLTGIFVQTAAAASANDKEECIKQNIKDLFASIDSDGSGYVNLEEFLQSTEHEHAKAYLAMLNLNTDDLPSLFRQLDEDHDGLVDIEEFITGCQKLKGFAKNVDMVSLSANVANLNSKLESICYRLERRSNTNDTNNAIVSGA
eukprot:TRINITY_DN18047_c0_g1_i1.p1 TRINITY_DN18047_c0_g1~~TRINITY_DN18047_c0_g1_i1.p1  ORF type:complete len:625 (+),score=91.54 TRINITY_DN18047_c0_g1_i1:58-1932(+)